MNIKDTFSKTPCILFLIIFLLVINTLIVVLVPRLFGGPQAPAAPTETEAAPAPAPAVPGTEGLQATVLASAKPEEVARRCYRGVTIEDNRIGRLADYYAALVHLSDETWWMLSKGQPPEDYPPPLQLQVKPLEAGAWHAEAEQLLWIPQHHTSGPLATFTLVDSAWTLDSTYPLLVDVGCPEE